jgi:hypothetical protein
LKFSISGKDTISRSERKEYQMMQAVVPQRARLLFRLDKNCLPDFGRNTVYIIDDPGQLSPPPGMPVIRGPEPLAAYLIAHDIQYVVYSYADEAAVRHRQLDVRLDPTARTNAWIRSGTRLAFDFQDNLSLLGHSREKLYDDGAIFVIDLATKVG